MNFRTWVAVVTVTGLLALVVPAPSAAAEASRSAQRGDMCERYREYTTSYSKKTTKGTAVWVPSGRAAGPFQFGGSQSLSTADGQLQARTKGTANTVGGTGGVNIGVVQASATYNHQWNQSTTKTSSFTRTFTTNSPTMPNDVNWRWRLYVRGKRFVVLKKCRVPTPLVDAGEYYVKKVVIVPQKRRHYTFHVERYKHRNWLLTIAGKPIPRLPKKYR